MYVNEVRIHNKDADVYNCVCHGCTRFFRSANVVFRISKLDLKQYYSSLCLICAIIYSHFFEFMQTIYVYQCFLSKNTSMWKENIITVYCLKRSAAGMQNRYNLQHVQYITMNRLPTAPQSLSRCFLDMGLLIKASFRALNSRHHLR